MPLALLLCAASPAAGQTVELWAGGGTVHAVAQPGSELQIGFSVLTAVEVQLSGMPVPVRLEAGFAQQDLRVRSGGLLSGDVQTVHGAITTRVAPWKAAPLSPYVIAGAAVFRHSTLTALRSSDAGVPDGEFALTTSEKAVGGLIGAGFTWRLKRVDGFAESRVTFSATDGAATVTLPVTIGVRLPVSKII